MCNEVEQPQPSFRTLDFVSRRCFVSLCVNVGLQCENSLDILAVVGNPLKCQYTVTVLGGFSRDLYFT